MNKSQKAFLRTLDKAVVQATEMYDSITEGLKIGGLENPKASEDMLDILDQFINASRRTSIIIQLAYDSETAWDMVLRAAGQQSRRSPGLMN